MWQQLHDISEDAKQQGVASAKQHEFDTLVDHIAQDYEKHGNRKPTPFETRALFLCKAEAKVIPCTDRNKAIALATIATLRIMEHLPEDKKKQIPDIIYTQAADHAKLTNPLSSEEKTRILQWIDFLDKVDGKVVQIQCAMRCRKARDDVHQKRKEHKGAIQVQKLHRGHKARKDFKERQLAAKKVQDSIRKRVAEEEKKVKEQEIKEKEAAVTVIQAQARKIAATAETEKLREQKAVERAEWKKEDTQSHIQELQLVKQAVEGLQKAVESVQTEAVNELKKTVDGMNELRRGLLAEKPNYMKGTHSNIMRRGRRRKGSESTDIPEKAKPTPSKDPLVFGPPRPKPKPKRGAKNKKKRGRGGGRGKSPYLRGPKPKDRYKGFAEGGNYQQYVKITYDLHGHRIPVPITPGGSADMPNLSLGHTMKGRPHYGVSEAIPNDPEFLDGMEGKGHPPWRSAGGKVRPSPPLSSRSKRSPPAHRGGRNQKHNVARMTAGITGDDAGIQTQKGWTLPRSKRLYDSVSVGRGSKELDQKAGVSPHLANWVEYRLHHRKRDLATKRRAEHLYNWEANKRKLQQSSFNESKYSDDFDNHFDSFHDSFGSKGLGHSDDFDADRLHKFEKQDLEHEAELMERLRRHDEETDGVHSPHRHLSARRPKPHFGSGMHSIVESDAEHRHGTVFEDSSFKTRSKRSVKSNENMHNGHHSKKQKFQNMFHRGHKKHIHDKYQNEIQQRELEMERMRQEMQGMKQSQFALKMKNASRSNREKIDMQVKLQMMENELKMQQLEKSELAKKHAEAERRKREYEAMHQQALLLHDEEKEMYRQQIKQSKQKGLASSLKMMSQKKKKERETEEMRQQSEQRIAEEMAKMYAEQQDEIKRSHESELQKLKKDIEKQQEIHEHTMAIATSENIQMQKALSAAEAESMRLAEAEKAASAEMKDMHASEVEQMRALHDEEMNKLKVKVGKKKFLGMSSKKALLNLQTKHDEELKAIQEKHQEDREDMQLGFDTEKSIIAHALSEERDRQEHDLAFDDHMDLDHLDELDPTGILSPQDASDDFAAALAAMGHTDTELGAEIDLGALAEVGNLPNEDHEAMQHHEFEGLLAQLEQTHIYDGGAEAANAHQDEEEHNRHMEDFLNSFSDGLDEQNLTPSMSEYDTDSVITGTEYTESLVPSSYAGTDSNVGTAHEELLRHHERSKRHETHLTETAHRVNHVIGALEDASRALDHPMHTNGY